MLGCPDQVCFEKLKEKLMNGVGAVYSNEVEMNNIAKNAITEYRVNIQGVKDQFKNSIIEVDSNHSEQKILEEIVRILFLKESTAPRRPPKIILMGPPGVDTREHAIEVSKKYMLINLDIDQICKDFVRRHGDNHSASQLRELMKSGEPIPDDIAMNLLKQRL